MIASSASSVAVRTAEEACRAEGVSLADLTARRPRQRGPRRDHWGVIFDVVACKLVTAGYSYPEAGATLGAAHSTVMAAAKRGRRVLDARATCEQIDRHGLDGLILIGKAIASGLEVCTPSMRPMFDDGEG